MVTSKNPMAPVKGAPVSTPKPAPAPKTKYTPPPLADVDTHPDAMQPSNDPYINEVRASGKNKSEDYQRMGNAELNAWKPYYAGNGKYKSQRGHPGLFDKPWECPPGMHPEGKDAFAPCVGKGGGAGGGGGAGAPGGGAGGGGGVGGSGVSEGDLALYKLKKVYADALADPSGQQAWKLFAGAGGAQQYQGAFDKARASIAGMPAGPAREKAEQDLREQQATAEIDMPQQAYQQALTGLTGVVDPELGYVKSERDRELQRWAEQQGFRLQGRGLDIQEELGLGNLGVAQGQLGLASSAQDFAQNQQFQEMIRQFNANQALQEKLGQWQYGQTGMGKVGTGLSALGKGVGIAASVAALF